MIEFINSEDKTKWNNLVKSFNIHDIYYLNGYVKAFQIIGDGEPFLISYESETNKAFCVIMKRDISNFIKLSNNLKNNCYYDVITPYGYGGFIFENEPTSKDLLELKTELTQIFKRNNIISAFFRFHPVLRNARFHESFSNVIDLGKTIAMDLDSPELIWQNITSKNRNMIRKAEKSGIEIKHGKGIDLLLNFKEIYNETMIKDNAEEYYFFNDSFYKSIDVDLKDNYEIFYAEYEGKIISMSIIIFDGNQMHYHLSGSKTEYRNLAPSNLLLYKAALWGNENGFKTFHLGGGVGSGEDNLYKFKASFNRNSNYQFSIGKWITNKEIYDQLVSFRETDANFDKNSNFFPLYRS